MTVCLLHGIGFTPDGKRVLPDTERSFPRVPCLGEDILIDDSPDTWRVVGVVWAADKPLIELSRVVR